MSWSALHWAQRVKMEHVQKTLEFLMDNDCPRSELPAHAFFLEHDECEDKTNAPAKYCRIG